MTLLNDPAQCSSDPAEPQLTSPTVCTSVTVLRLQCRIHCPIAVSSSVHDSNHPTSKHYRNSNRRPKSRLITPRFQFPLSASKTPGQQSRRSTAINHSMGHSTSFVAVVLLRCVILMLIKDFPHKSGCAKGDLIAAPSLSPFCAVKHTNRQALLSVRLSLLPLLSSGIAGKSTHTHFTTHIHIIYNNTV